MFLIVYQCEIELEEKDEITLVGFYNPFITSKVKSKVAKMHLFLHKRLSFPSLLNY